jgi:SAM-dependent methyltransferase
MENSIMKNWNPYLAEYREFNGACRMEFLMRDILCREYAWSVPSEAALSEVLLHGSLVEIGCGAGYWARALQERGADIVAIDLHPIELGENKSCNAKKSFTKVVQGDASLIANYPGRALLIAWPVAGVGTDALHHFSGDIVIYIGQPKGGDGGTTGDDEFHRQLAENFTLTKEVALPQWIQRQDSMYVYRRKHPGGRKNDSAGRD